MTAIGLDGFVDSTVRWAHARDDQMRFNWPVKGGWEGWVQVDLTAFILAGDSTVDILREQAIYTSSRMHCDLLVDTTLPPAGQIAVEIKAQSFENRANFVSGVVGDLEKLDEQRLDAYAESTCVVVGLAFDAGIVQAILDIQHGDHRIFRELGRGEVSTLVAIWTHAGGWLSAEAATTRGDTHADGLER